MHSLGIIPALANKFAGNVALLALASNSLA
jgi:hypothetical protein